MKRSIWFLAISIIAVTFICLYFFFSNSNSQKNQNFKEKAEQYNSANEKLTRSADSIDEQVKIKEEIYKIEKSKIENSIEVLSRERKKNLSRIDSNSKYLNQLKLDYCKELKKLGQADLEIFK